MVEKTCMNMKRTTYCSSDISAKLRPWVSRYDLEMVHRLEQQYNGKMIYAQF